MSLVECLPLTLSGKLVEHQLEPYENSLTLLAASKTDLFHDPIKETKVSNIAKMLHPFEQDVIFSAKLKVHFRETFDAGVLLVYHDKDNWAKLCFEYTPEHYPSIVSVVTRGISDDCNSVFIDSDQIYLRLAKMGDAYAFFHSTDGKYWYLVRVFALAGSEQVQLGFAAQSPLGEGCRVRFSEIQLRYERLEDIRSHR